MKKVKNYHILSLAVILLVMLVGFGILASRQNQTSSVDNGMSSPQPSNVTTIADNTGCYDIKVYSKGKREGSLKDYIKSFWSISSIEEAIDKTNSYGLQGTNVVVMKPLGVGNINTIFYKSRDGEIYMMEVNSLNLETPDNCVDLQSIIPRVVKGSI